MAGRVDPVGNHNFLVTLVDSTSVFTAVLSTISTSIQAGFSECSGLEMALQVEELREGGRNDTVLKFPSRVTWTNIRLRRGAAISDDLWKWHYGFVQGMGKRRDGIIVLQNDEHDAVRTWRFTRGIPVKWTGPAMNAGQSQVAIEELEIAHEGLVLVSAGPLTSVAAAVGAIASALGGQ